MKKSWFTENLRHWWSFNTTTEKHHFLCS